MPIHGVDNVKKAMRKRKREANKSLRAIYFSGLSLIVKGTPADEGRARNNWFLTVGTPFTLSAGRDKDKNGAASEASLDGIPKSVIGNKVYFTNNLPYIGMLEYGGYPSPVKNGTYLGKGKGYEIRSINGYSKQVAPSGWVRKNIILMQNKIRSL